MSNTTPRASSNVDDFETLAFALQALRRWQRCHGLLGKAVFALKDPEAAPLVREAILADGFADSAPLLRSFEDVLVLAPPRHVA